MNNKKELQVAALENGTVIDHIPSTDDEINRIAVVAPNVKLNIIRNYEVVEKRELSLPDELIGIVKCANPKCITNNEPMLTRFHVVDKEKCIIRCHYCEKEQERKDITLL